MVVDENALQSVMTSKKEMVLFKDDKIIPEKMYELVCADDYFYPLGGGAHFKAGVPTKINGLFAKNIVKNTRGKVQFVDKELWNNGVADKSRDSEIAELKETVAMLLNQKKASEIVKNVVPETKGSKSTKIVEE